MINIISRPIETKLNKLRNPYSKFGVNNLIKYFLLQIIQKVSKSYLK